MGEHTVFGINIRSFQLFFKSAFITALIMLLVAALIIGVLAADKNTGAAVGSAGGLQVKALDDKVLRFSLFGNDYSIDGRFTEYIADKIYENYDVLPLDIKYYAFLYEKIFEMLSEYA